MYPSIDKQFQIKSNQMCSSNTLATVLWATTLWEIHLDGRCRQVVIFTLFDFRVGHVLGTTYYDMSWCLIKFYLSISLFGHLLPFWLCHHLNLNIFVLPEQSSCPCQPTADGEAWGVPVYMLTQKHRGFSAPGPYAHYNTRMTPWFTTFLTLATLVPCTPKAVAHSLL